MRILGLDFEATDKDPRTARITEVGALFWNGIEKTPLELGVLSVLVYAPDYPAQNEEVIRVTSITDEMLRSVGQPPKEVLTSLIAMMEKAEYVAAYNGGNYDKILFEEECNRHGVTPPALLWLDVMVDVPYPKHFTCKKLSHLALDHGIAVNPKDLHRATSDVELMLKLLALYDIQEVIRYAQAPTLTVRAVVHYDDREKAKARQYRWEGTKKLWLKQIKKFQLEQEIAEASHAGFKVVVIEEGKASV